jgi:hypothetical protein
MGLPAAMARFMNTSPVFTGGCYCGEVRYKMRRSAINERPMLLPHVARRFRVVPGICSWRLTLRPSSSRRGTPDPSIKMIARGFRPDNSARPSVFEGPQLVTWTSEM